MASPEHVENLIIGSGFGGSVTAYRLAEAGKQVRVLERGKSYPPGSFARTPAEMSRALWDPSAGLHGMFDVWAFDGIDAVVASGLGGGSLIYANVLLRKDEDWFINHSPVDSSFEAWPFSRADLDPHYDHAEAMLAPQKLPFSEPIYHLDKTALLQDAARAKGLDWELVPLAVRFANDGRPPVPGEPLAGSSYPNIHGKRRRTCTLCGECDIGCNEGAKNTLDHTYLSAAAHHGADIRTRSEVRDITKRSDGVFEVSYVEHDPENEGRPTRTDQLPLVTVTADRVVMAAGSLGSTFLLLKNRDGLPGLSPALGSKYCGNGDLLGLLLKSHNADGVSRPVKPFRGPVITSTIRVERDNQLAYIQDAGYPAFLSWIVEATQLSNVARRAAHIVWNRVMDLLRKNWTPQLGADIQRIIGNGDFSECSMPLLGMGIDIPDGKFAMDKGRLSCDWNLKTSGPHFSLATETMKTIADASGAGFELNPTWLLKRVVTVHSLGGCPASLTPADGVVDAYGEAHGVPGLWVVDGAAIPGPVGPNPSLTIAAFADRATERMLQQ